MKNGNLGTVADLATKIMTATEAMLPFERTATLHLRAAALSIQLDTQLMSALLSALGETTSTSTKIPINEKEEYTQAGHELINTLTAALSAENLGVLVERLRNTDKGQHQPIVNNIEDICLEVETGRRAFDKAFKAYWLPRYLAMNTLSTPSTPPTKEMPEQLVNLSNAFHERPFGIGSFEDSFVAATPASRGDVLALKAYRKCAENMGMEWARAYSQGERTLEAFTAIQNEVLTLTWGGGIEAMLNIDTKAFVQPKVDFSELEEAEFAFSSGLRDSILRHQSSLFSMVFVGAENSGKSTFLNAFIGINILPTGDVPTTSYPVRIRHTPGQTTVAMKMGVVTLNDYLGRLREGDWVTRVTVLLDDMMPRNPKKKPKWRGQDLPRGFDFDRLKARWALLGRSAANRLKQLIDKKSGFPETVTGAENILEALRDVNDFVRICRNLPIGFDHFAPEDWPMISLEFPNLDKGPTGQILEGIGGSNVEYKKDEAIQQTIRAAKSIVAVVSLRQFESPDWEELPGFIASRTNVKASGVIVTMADTALIMETDLDLRLKYIRRVFWPDIDRDVKDVPIFFCSTTVGIEVEPLKHFLAEAETLPEFSSFWTPALAQGSLRLFPSRMKSFYEGETLESLRESAEEAFQASGLPGTINALLQIVEKAKTQTLLVESEGMISQSKRIAFDLRRMLAAVGRALGDVETPTSADDRRISDDSMSLLDWWESSSDEFLRSVQLMVVAKSEKVASEVETCVTDAMLRAWHEIKGNAASSSPDPICFEQPDDVGHYVQLYSDALMGPLTALERSNSQEILTNVEQRHSALFFRLREKVMEIDSSIAERLPRSMGDGSVTSSSLPIASKDDFSKTLVAHRTRYSVMHNFRAIEKRILQLLLRNDDIEERLQELGFVSKCLLALVSTLPYLLTLPYSLRRTYIDSYQIGLNQIRQRLIDLARARSFDILGQIEQKVTISGQLELKVATEAISSTILVPEGYSTADALPHVTPAQLQEVNAAFANLIAFNAAVGWIHDSVQGIK